MAKVNYTNLKLKTNTAVKTFEIEGQEIEVLQYLPVDEKYDLIMITLGKSKEGDVYNELKIDMYFHLFIVYLYTNLSFTEKQKENNTKLFDVLTSNGIIQKVIENIPENEYNYLVDLLHTQKENDIYFNTSALGLISRIIDELPANAQQAMDIVNNFNPEQFSAVVDFAKAANNGRLA